MLQLSWPLLPQACGLKIHSRLHLAKATMAMGEELFALVDGRGFAWITVLQDYWQGSVIADTFTEAVCSGVATASCEYDAQSR